MVKVLTDSLGKVLVSNGEAFMQPDDGGFEIITDTTSTDPSILLQTMKEYIFTQPLESLTITLPEDVPDDLNMKVKFKSSVDGIGTVFPQNIECYGFECTDKVFVPLKESEYDLNFTTYQNRISCFVNRSMNLPERYQRCEYIESSGTQWINTGLYIDDADYVYLKANVTGTDNAYGYLFGNFGNNITCTRMFFRASDNKYWGGIQTSTAASYNVDLPINQTAEYEVYDNVFAIDGVEHTFTKQQSISKAEDPLYIFTNGTDKTNRSCKMKVYGCICKNLKEEVRNFVPCYRKADGVIGLYDIAYGEFYTNSGTDEFIKGGDV